MNKKIKFLPNQLNSKINKLNKILVLHVLIALKFILQFKK